MATIIPAIPIRRGTRVRKLFHGCWVPPQEIATKKAVTEETKIKPPIQSTRRSFSARVSVFGFRLSTNGIVANPIPQNGNMR
jgi:hypothetical protein